MTDEPIPQETGMPQGDDYKIGPGHPPRNRRFGQPGGNPINKKGVPSSAIEVRRLIQKIGAQRIPLPQSEKEKAERKRKKYISRLEALLTAMFFSRAPADKQTILKGGYPGLLKDEIELGESVVHLIVEYTDKPKTNEPKSDA
jgi:hypothetical protein